MTDTPSARRPVAAALSGGSNPRLPKVVASGYGKVAEEILDLAWKNGVKVREDADLAEILAALDLEEDVPFEALHAICEILSHVYRANGDMARHDQLKGNEP